MTIMYIMAIIKALGFGKTRTLLCKSINGSSFTYYFSYFSVMGQVTNRGSTAGDVTRIWFTGIFYFNTSSFHGMKF